MTELNPLHRAILAAEEKAEYVSLDADRGLGLRMGGLDSVVGIPRDAWFKIIEERRLDQDVDSFAAFVRNEVAALKERVDEALAPKVKGTPTKRLTNHDVRIWLENVQERLG